MSQRIEILRHLAKGRALTTFEAFEKFRCTRLAARIAEIRDDGHNVSAEMVKTSGGARVALYRITKSLSGTLPKTVDELFRMRKGK